MAMVPRQNPQDLIAFEAQPASSGAQYLISRKTPVHIVITTWKKGPPPAAANIGVVIWDTDLRKQYRPPNDCHSRFPAGAVLKTWDIVYATDLWFDFLKPDDASSTSQYFALIEVYDQDQNPLAPSVKVDVNRPAGSPSQRVITLKFRVRK